MKPLANDPSKAAWRVVDPSRGTQTNYLFVTGKGETAHTPIIPYYPILGISRNAATPIAGWFIIYMEKDGETQTEMDDLVGVPFF